MGLLVLALGGCKAHGNYERVEILNAIAPSASCEWVATNAPNSQGFYDPSVDNASGYQLGFAIQNNMQKYTDDPIPYGEVTTLTGTYHDVQVVGAEGCWYLADANNLPPGAYDNDAHIVDCSKIPTQAAALITSGGAIEGLGQGAAAVRVLTLPHLQSLFGPSFNPNQIPPRGAFISNNPADNPSVAGINQTTATILAYDFGAEDPAQLQTRSAAWGNFPDDYHAEVVVQVRLRMQLQDNTTFWTNYYSYPITVCPRCLQGMCGKLTQQSCARGPCGDGTPCLSNGTCANTALTCSAITLFTGNVPDFLTGTCLAAQDFGSTTAPTCVPVGCNQQAQ